MDWKQITGLVMGVVIGVLLLTTLAMPVISDATTTEKTFTNDGYFRMTETEDETVISWTPSVDPFTITVNDEDVSLDSLKQQGYSNYSLAFADDFILRYYYESPTVQNLQIWKSAFVVGIGSSSANTATITINANGITWESSAEDSTPQTITHTGSYFVIDSNGEYSMKYRNEAAYVHPDSSLIYAGGISLISGSTFTGFYFEGTSDNLTVTPMTQTVTISNIESHTSEISGYVNLYALDKVTFTTTYTSSNPNVDTNQTYSYFLVPYQVTAELAEHLDSSTIQLLSIIPLLITVGIIIAVVGVFVMRRE